MQEEEDLGPCPSFNYYSTNGVADTAGRVIGEFTDGSPSNCSVSDYRRSQLMNSGEDAEEEQDFEFISLQKIDDRDAFCADPTGPVFPIFNYDLIFEGDRIQGVDINYRDLKGAPPMVPLEKLLIRDRDDDPPSLSSSSSSSSSSSEVDELEGIPPGTYCVWNPKSAETTNLKCKKSRSTGSLSSKRWRIRDFLRRSHSDGKKSYISFKPSSTSKSTKKTREAKTEKSEKNLKERKIQASKAHVAGKTKGKTVAGEKKVSTAHESFYVRHRTLREESSRKSYLPYRQDLVGFWTNVSGLGKISLLH